MPDTPILAADPGLSGAIAYGDGDVPVAVAMPDDLEEETGMVALHHILADIRSRFPNIRAVVEKVGGYIGSAQPASSAFVFGGADGALRMGLACNGIPVRRVAPVSWQRHLDLPKRSKTAAGKAQHKRDLRDLAASLYPSLRPTLKTADAILLYHLARSGTI